MVEGVEELGAEFHMKLLADVEDLASGEVCTLLSGTLQNVFSGIAEAIARGILKVVNVKPHIDIRMVDMATADLLGAHKSLRACVGWVITDDWRKGETRTEDDDAPEVPSTQDRIRCPSPVQVLLTFPNRNSVIQAGDPALVVIEIRESCSPDSTGMVPFSETMSSPIQQWNQPLTLLRHHS